MFKNQSQRNFLLLGLLLKIHARYWFTNYLNLVIGLGVAIFTMVCWLAFKSGDPFLLVSGISVGILRNGMIIYTYNLVDWKATRTSDRFKTTRLTPQLLALASVLFNFLTTVMVGVLMFAIAMLFFPAQRDLLPNTNWLMVFSGFFFTWIMSLVIGLFFFTFVKSLVYCRMIMLIYYTLAVYFLGLGFPLETILSYSWIGSILYAFPHRFALNIAQAGFANWHGVNGGESIMIIKGMPIYGPDGQITNYMNVDFGYQGHIWLVYVCAIVTLLFYLAISVGKISYQASFHRRNSYGELIVNQSSSRYLHQIKKGQDFQQVNLLHKARIEELKERTPQLREMIDQVQHESSLWEKIKIKKRPVKGS